MPRSNPGRGDRAGPRAGLQDLAWLGKKGLGPAASGSRAKSTLHASPTQDEPVPSTPAQEDQSLTQKENQKLGLGARQTKIRIRYKTD